MSPTPASKPSVLFLADASPLSLELIRHLLHLGCGVKIITGNKRAWKFVDTSLFISEKDASRNQFQYLAVFGQDYIKSAIPLAKSQRAKTIVVVNRALGGTNWEHSLVGELSHLKIVYLADLFGPGEKRSQSGLLSQIASRNELLVAENLDTIDLISFKDASRLLAKVVFSYWSGLETFYLACLLPVGEFIKYAKIFAPEINVFRSGKATLPSPVVGMKTLTPASFDSESFYQDLTLIKQLQRPKQKRKAFVFPRVKMRKAYLLFFLVLLIFLLPFISFLCSGLLGAAAYKSIKSGNSVLAARLFSKSAVLSRASETVFDFYSKIPVVNFVSSPFAKNAELATKLASIGESGARVYFLSHTLVTNILEAKEYDLDSLSQSLHLELGSLYQSISFLEGEMDQSIFLSKFIPQKEKLSQARRYLFAAKEISAQLPQLISGKTPKTYLVLLQNNMELRPAGGFIGSFALVSFDKGKLIDTPIYDVYSADGQLKGHVEPPMPIKNYLGEANWYLRDSNWDPDFVKSAKRAEWFLEKEMDREVEGTIAIDLEIVKDALSILGPVKLSDFGGIEINQHNFYEKVQHEVEANFFPGSQKKSSFLTSVANEVLVKATKETSQNYLGFAEILLKNLQTRSVQLAMHNPQVSSALSSLNWDGAVAVPDHMWIGLAEANVGVNKANYYIRRENYLEVTLNQGRADYLLRVKLTNSSTDGLALGGRYKGYLRALARPGSSFSNIEISSNTGVSRVSPEIFGAGDRVEAGVVVEVPPGEGKTITFRFSEPLHFDFASFGHTSFTWRKQAGVGSDPLTVLFKAPERELFGNPPFNLTKDGFSGYNTILDQDKTIELSW